MAYPLDRVYIHQHHHYVMLYTIYALRNSNTRNKPRTQASYRNIGAFGISFFTGFLLISVLVVITTKLKKESKESIDTAQPIRQLVV